MVPPKCNIPPTERGVNRLKEFVSKPSQPLSKPTTSKFLEQAIRTTPRIAAFMPGASPPLVTTPIIFTITPSYRQAHGTVLAFLFNFEKTCWLGVH